MHYVPWQSCCKLLNSGKTPFLAKAPNRYRRQDLCPRQQFHRRRDQHLAPARQIDNLGQRIRQNGLDPTVVSPAAKSVLSRFCADRRPDFLQKASFVKSDDPAGWNPVDLIDETRPGSRGEMSKVSSRGRRPVLKSRTSWAFLPNGGW